MLLQHADESARLHTAIISGLAALPLQLCRELQFCKLFLLGVEMQASRTVCRWSSVCRRCGFGCNFTSAQLIGRTSCQIFQELNFMQASIMAWCCCRESKGLAALQLWLQCKFSMLGCSTGQVCVVACRLRAVMCGAAGDQSPDGAAAAAVAAAAAAAIFTDVLPAKHHAYVPFYAGFGQYLVVLPVIRGRGALRLRLRNSVTSSHLVSQCQLSMLRDPPKTLCCRLRTVFGAPPGHQRSRGAAPAAARQPHLHEVPQRL